MAGVIPGPAPVKRARDPFQNDFGLREAEIVRCGSCRHIFPPESGKVAALPARCPACGWMHAEERHTCVGCRGALKVRSVSLNRQQANTLGVFTLLAGGAIGFALGGLTAAVAVPFAVATLAVAFSVVTIGLRCARCGKVPDPEFLTERELAAAGRAVKPRLLLAAGILVVGAALSAVTLAVPAVVGSDGLSVKGPTGPGFEAQPPSVGGLSTRKDVRSFRGAGGQVVHGLTATAMNEEGPGPVFFVVLAPHGKSAKGPADTDALDATLAGYLRLNRAEPGVIEDATAGGKPGRAAAFSGQINGKQVQGRVRAERVDDDILLVGWGDDGSGKVDEAMGQAFIESLKRMP